MTDPEPYHWPSSNLSGQNQDNDQIFHLPKKSIPMTYLQQQQPVVNFLTYVFSYFLCQNVRGR